MTHWLGHDDKWLKGVIIYNSSNSACLLCILHLQESLFHMTSGCKPNSSIRSQTFMSKVH